MKASDTALYDKTDMLSSSYKTTELASSSV